MSLDLTTLYEYAGITFREIASYQDLRIVVTPEGFRFECPPPYVKYSRAFHTKTEALFHAERFCAMRRRSRTR